MTSDLVVLHDSEDCFSHIQLIGTNFRLPKLHKTLPRLCGLFGDECNASLTKSHKSRAEMQSMRNPASTDITFDAVELCETAVSFFHTQLIHKMHPGSGNFSVAPAGIRVSNIFL